MTWFLSLWLLIADAWVPMPLPPQSVGYGSLKACEQAAHWIDERVAQTVKYECAGVPQT